MKIAFIVLGFAFSGLAFGQQQGVQTPIISESTNPEPAAPAVNVSPDLPPALLSGDYRIVRDDVIQISVFQLSDVDRIVRVPASGIITLPYIESIKVTDSTTEELQVMIEDRLRGRFLKNPHVTVSVQQYASQPVTILGLVKSPGIKQIKGDMNLTELIAMANGLDPNASSIQIVRHTGHGPNRVSADPININVDDLLQNGNSSLNVPIYGGDIVNVLRAGSVSVVGEVKHPTEIVLKSGKRPNVTQALIASGLFTGIAKPGDSFILRYTADGTRIDIPVKADKILAGSAPDIILEPNDVLWVPSSKLKSGLSRISNTAVDLALRQAIRVVLF